MSDELTKQEKIDPAAKEHNSPQYGLSVLKGVIGAIPYVGTAINEVAFEARSRL